MKNKTLQEHLKAISPKGVEARWAGHTKQTKEQKREYMREYMRKRRLKKQSNEK